MKITNRLEEINTNTYGTKMKIVAYRSYTDIDVEFLDEHHYVKKHNNYHNFKVGGIKNPYDKWVYGVGAIGDGRFKVKIETNGDYTPEYTAWVNMLKRCYYQKKNAKNDAYLDRCTVCEEWLNFQNFALWFEKHKYYVNERLHVDKDISNPCNTVYSPKTCFLTPQKINMLFMNKPNKRGLPNGIIKYPSGYLAKYNHKDLGIYNTLEEAYKVYSKEKKNEIVKVANEYKGIIPNELYEALLNYEFLITNDKNYKVA